MVEEALEMGDRLRDGLRVGTTQSQRGVERVLMVV
jgi:hypothetical protein